MELHTCLWNDVDAFSFSEKELLDLKQLYPDLLVKVHQSIDAFLSEAHQADFVLTWDFKADWYARCPKLKAVFTPAAGNDWVERDPQEKVELIHGAFHGPILAESLLSAILFMNHQMPAMIRNYQAKAWDRNLQKNSNLLGSQRILIIGLGAIGIACAKLIQHTGAEVIGVRRNPEHHSDQGIKVSPLKELDALLPLADHVVLLLPGSSNTDGFMNTERLRLMKPGSYLYNFGRGNALKSDELLKALPHLGGAFLDVTDEEPLPLDSPLWHKNNVMITPHSSCVYRQYTSMFISEVANHLKTYF